MGRGNGRGSWEKFFMERWGKGDLTDMEGVYHPGQRLLQQYWHQGEGGLVVLGGEEWTEGE